VHSVMWVIVLTVISTVMSLPWSVYR